MNIFRLAILATALLTAGCQTFTGEPKRLYLVSEEAAEARDVNLPSIVAAYNAATSDVMRMGYRNEYVARRMYIVDLEYTEFETALTRERQEFGFGSAMVAQGLSTAGAVFTPASTVRILSALTSGANASRGLYDSELLVNKTIQIVQSQMQSKRDDVATRIFGRVRESSLTYPLSAALHDLEDYYRAGTLTSGLIKATAEAATNAALSAEQKVAAINQQALVIGDIKNPLPSVAPLGIKSPTRLIRYEENLAPKYIQQIQTALCVVPPADDFGTDNSAARTALSNFFVGAGATASRTIDSIPKLNLINAAVAKIKAHGGSCGSAGYADAGKVGAAVKRTGSK
jgi:hypothetical protein